MMAMAGATNVSERSFQKNRDDPPTKLNMAALIRPTLSPKLSRPAARAESVIVKLSHDKTGREGKELLGRSIQATSQRSKVTHKFARLPE